MVCFFALVAKFNTQLNTTTVLLHGFVGQQAIMSAPNV